MFITFEGIEGSGKGTLLRAVTAWLEESKYSFIATREPGDSVLGRQLRTILLDVYSNIGSVAELFLYLADRAQHVEEVIAPALHANKIVLCDRYADSTIVYQGYGRGLSVKELVGLNERATNGLWPDITFLLDVSPEIGLGRAIKRNNELGISEKEGRFEAEELSFHNRIRNGYLEWAQQNSRFCIINGEQTVQEVAKEVISFLEQKLTASHI